MAIRDRSDMPANVINVDRGPRYPRPVTKQAYMLVDDEGRDLGFSHATGNPWYFRDRVRTMRNRGEAVHMLQYSTDTGDYVEYPEEKIAEHIAKVQKNKTEIVVDQRAVSLVSQVANVSKGVSPLLNKSKLSKQELTEYVSLLDETLTYMQGMLDSLQ